MSRKAAFTIILSLLTAMVVFSLFSLKYIHQPVAKMELFFLKAGESSFSDGVPKVHMNRSAVVDYQTHLYPLALGWIFKILGPSCISARIAGAFFGLISIVFIFVAIYKLFPGTPDERAVFAAIGGLLLATSPAALCGFASIDIDNGFLVPIYIATSLLFIAILGSPSIPNIAGLAIITAVMIWTKVMNVPMLIAATLIYMVFGGMKFSTKIKLFVAVALGFVLFFATWQVYCDSIGLDYRGPFKYMLSSFRTTTGETAKSSSGLAVSFFIYALWMNPFFILLLAGGVVSRGQSILKTFRMEKEDIFPIFSAMIVFGYLLIGGVVSGFPRYACPAVPLGYIFFLFMARKRHGAIELKDGAYIAMAAACAAIIYYYPGDLIYALRYTIRENSALSVSSAPLLKELALKAAISSFAFVGVFIFFYSKLLVKKPVLILIAFILGANIATTARYQLADYDVGYQHGGRGTRQVVDLVKPMVNGKSKFLLPVEIVYYLHKPYVNYAYGELTGDKIMVERLKDPDNEVFVYSIVTQPVSSYRYFSTNPEIVNILATQYSLTEIGTFKVWIRNKKHADI